MNGSALKNNYPGRRGFLKKAIGGAALLTFGFGTEKLFAKEDLVKITLLHTNDVHSRIDPFPMDGGKYQGLGGVASRSALINKIRSEEKNVLLFDAGDIFQGTPYFNFYGGELEIKMMSMMGYDASTMGNHDFDNNVEGFAKQLVHANFPILTANYDFSDTALSGKTKNYQIFKKDGVKIGVFGLGIELKGLVNKEQYGNTVYLDALKKAREMEDILKLEQACDLVICLSHIGYEHLDKNKINDVDLARNTKYIDLVIGGHTHKFLDHPDRVKNLNGKETLVNQVGYAGINLGRVDFYFNRLNNQKINYSSALQEVRTNFKI